jgi:hypothetical protein
MVMMQNLAPFINKWLGCRCFIWIHVSGGCPSLLER